MRLRRATLEDMPAVAALHRLTLRVSLPYLPELHTPQEDCWWFSERLFPANAVWLAHVGETLAGYVAAAPGWLNHLYVHPDHQGAGTGAALLARVMADADELRLWTFQRNARARTFYERRGFVLERLADGTDNEEGEPDALYRWTRPAPGAGERAQDGRSMRSIKASAPAARQGDAIGALEALMNDRLGVWSATAAALAAVAYDIPQLLQVFGVLRDPWDRILIFAPSLVLAPAFVLAMAAAHWRARSVWSLAALALSVLYAADVSLVYIVQLGAVIPHDLQGTGAEVAFAACCGFHRPATAVDLLGYAYMSGATALLAPAFPGGGTRRWLRRALILNGLIGPLLVGQLVWPWLIYAASPWIVVFPAAMLLLAKAQAEPDAL